jgi:nicotinate-nucleotide adenylyltransferase
MKRSPSPLRLGLLGGSFDPVHIGHVLLARWAREQLRLDEVWLIPQAQSADGKRLTPMLQRWRRLQRALKGEAGLRACDVDLRLGGVSRTVETLRQLRYELGPGPKFTWLLGQDQAQGLGSWMEADELPKLCALSFFRRPGCEDLSARVYRRFRCIAINSPSIGISSSLIRQQKQAGKTLDLAKAF